MSESSFFMNGRKVWFIDWLIDLLLDDHWWFFFLKNSQSTKSHLLFHSFCFFDRFFFERIEKWVLLSKGWMNKFNSTWKIYFHWEKVNQKSGSFEQQSRTDWKTTLWERTTQLKQSCDKETETTWFKQLLNLELKLKQKTKTKLVIGSTRGFDYQKQQ